MTESVSLLLALLTTLSQVVLVVMLVLFCGSRVSGALGDAWESVTMALGPVALWMAWAVATVAIAGSLYFSEGAGYVPCELCWYQRIAIYPMVVLLGVAAYRRDFRVAVYSAPLALAGVAISAYHYQLQRLPSQASEFCDPANPCSSTWVWELSYISIPMMAMTAGLLIAALTLIARSAGQQDEQGELDAAAV